MLCVVCSPKHSQTLESPVERSQEDQHRPGPKRVARQNRLIRAELLVHTRQHSVRLLQSLLLIQRLLRLLPHSADMLEPLLARLELLRVHDFRHTASQVHVAVHFQVDFVQQLFLFLIHSFVRSTFPSVNTHWQGIFRLYATSITPVFSGSVPLSLNRWPSGYTTHPVLGLTVISIHNHYRTDHLRAKNSVNQLRLMPRLRWKNHTKLKR